MNRKVQFKKHSKRDDYINPTDSLLCCFAKGKVIVTDTFQINPVLNDSMIFCVILSVWWDFKNLNFCMILSM